MHDTIREHIQAMIKGAITGAYVDTGVGGTNLNRSGSKMSVRVHKNRIALFGNPFRRGLCGSHDWFCDRFTLETMKTRECVI
jgi:hypothetical protein